MRRSVVLDTPANLQAAFTGEMNTRERYLAFAVQAEAEGHPSVALLLTAPLLVLASLLAGGACRAWVGAALVTMALGAAAAWLAVGSGHAAGQMVDKTPELEAAILRHEGLGVGARNLFTLLALVWAALLLAPAWARRPIPAGLRIGAQAAFLVAYVAAAGLVARAADAGGRLVHERGVRAMVVTHAPETPSGVPPARRRRRRVRRRHPLPAAATRLR